MGIFQRLLKSQPASKPDAEISKSKTEVSESVPETLISPVAASPRAVLLTSPRVSEKAAVLAAKGTYVFQVPIAANKVEIRKAVEAAYKVSVTGVRTIRGQGKRVRRGRIAGVRNRWKKALVTVKSGQKIEMYKGV